MESSSKKVRLAAWTILAGVIVYVCVAFVREQSRKSNLPVIGEVQPFALTNQLGEQITFENFKGKVWVADIIFTRCPGPCPRMTQAMAGLQETFGTEKNFRSVSLTTDPGNDTPTVLKDYAEKFNANSERWWFLTGTKEQIKQVAQRSLKLGAEEKSRESQENPNDLFIHTTVFILVDKLGRMRGQAYESLEPDFRRKIDQDIRALLREG